MKLRFDVPGTAQADPYIFADGGKYYLYVTAHDGVTAWSADAPDGLWHFEGVICRVPGGSNYWAPCILKTGGRYYLYFSCDVGDDFEHLHAAAGDGPLGPFTETRELFDRFSIDAHAVETPAGLFLFYAEDNTDTGRIGTRVFVDRLLDPMTPANLRKEIIVPTMDEEIFQKNRCGDGRDWHTIEGPFWFAKDGWQYITYSGACFMNDTYHVGYAAAHTDEEDLTKVEFMKHTENGAFDPLLIKNEDEEGTGHNSVLEQGGELFIVYHGRDYGAKGDECRTARMLPLSAKDGKLFVPGRK